MVKKSNRSKVIILASVLFFVFLVFLLNSFSGKIGPLESKSNFSVDVLECKFDGREEGVLSFSFDITVKENPTRVPSQIVFQIIDVYKNYSLDKFPFFHGVNLTREYKLDRIYQPEDVINNVTFAINNVYRDYTYLPSEYFNYQLFYCDFTNEELNRLKESKEIFDVLDSRCFLFFDFEHFYKNHVYALLSHPGKQCVVIPREE